MTASCVEQNDVRPRWTATAARLTFASHVCKTAEGPRQSVA